MEVGLGSRRIRNPFHSWNSIGCLSIDRSEVSETRGTNDFGIAMRMHRVWARDGDVRGRAASVREDVLNSFIELNNIALLAFFPKDRSLVGVRTGSGHDRAAGYSGGNFQAQRRSGVSTSQASNSYFAPDEVKDRPRVLRIVRDSAHMRRTNDCGISTYSDDVFAPRGERHAG